MHAAQEAQINRELAEYTVNGLKSGFHPGIPWDAQPVSAKSNHPIPPLLDHQIYEDIIHGLDRGFILGPFAPFTPLARETFVSPLGTALKKNTTKIRVIQDLSHGKKLGTSVNSFIAPEFTKIKYISTKQIARMVLSLGIGAYIWVIDMAEAYRRVLLAPYFHKFLGFKWDGLIYRYACLPFGLSSSPKIYSEFAECLRQIVVFSEGDLYRSGDLISLMNYLDDFCSGHKSKEEAERQFRVFKEWLEYLGVPTQDKKCYAPNTIAIILGFLYNTISQSISVPQDKIEIILQAIDNLLQNHRSTTRREVASVSGKLNWTCQVVFGGRAMLRQIEHLINVKLPWDARKLRLNRTVIEDLKWWKLVLQSDLNSIPLSFIIKDPSDADIHVWSDAAGAESLGFGAFCSLNYFYQLKWTDFKLPNNWKSTHIIRSELLALVTAAMVWGPKFSGKSITFHCDNKTVVSHVKSKSTPSHRPDLLHLIRWLTFIALKYRFYFWIEWIPGSENIEADNLSRFKKAPFERIYQQKNIDEYLEPFFSSNKINSFDDNFKLIQTNAHAATLKCFSPISSDFLHF